jgi:hypothetical protein
MALEYFIVAYIDILGFTNMVRNDCENLSNTKYLELLRECFNSIKNTFKQLAEIIQFSDSIIISLPLEKKNVINIIEITQNIQAEMFKKKILVRGGISFGKHFSESDFLFSDALINAYELEKKQAINPRIVISNDLLDFCDDINLFLQEGKILKEDDDKFFINYLRLITVDECNTTLNLLFSDGNKNSYSIAEKYRWLYEYAVFYFDNQIDVIFSRFTKTG